MTRREARLFIKAGADALNLPFGSGRISEFNSKVDKQYPTAWLETLEVDPDIQEHGLPMDNWQVNIHVAKLDTTDSTADQYESIIDDCDVIAQKLVHQYNNQLDDAKLVSILGYSRTPFIKKHADCLTGVLLSFTMNAPDNTSAICN